MVRCASTNFIFPNDLVVENFPFLVNWQRNRSFSNKYSSIGSWKGDFTLSIRTLRPNDNQHYNSRSWCWGPCLFVAILNDIMLSVMLNIVMLSVIFHLLLFWMSLCWVLYSMLLCQVSYLICCHSECHYAECHISFVPILNVIMLSVIFHLLQFWVSLCWVLSCWMSLCWVTWGKWKSCRCCHVWPFYERAVSDLDRSMQRSRWV